MPVNTSNKEHHWPGICKKNATSWRNEPGGSSWRSTKAKAKFCCWGGITWCPRTGCTPEGQSAALQKMTWSPCGQEAEQESALWPCTMETIVFWATQVRLQPPDWERWSFSAQHLGDIWRCVPSLGLSSTRKTLMCWSKSAKAKGMVRSWGPLGKMSLLRIQRRRLTGDLTAVFNSPGGRA